MKYKKKVTPHFFPILGYWIDAVSENSDDAGEKINLNYLKEDKNKDIKLKLTNFGKELFFLLNDTELIKDASTTKLQYYKKNMDDILLTTELFQKGILFESGEKWKQQRQLMAPLFTYGQIKERIQTMIICVDELMISLEKPEEQKNLMKNLQKTTGDIVCCSFFGDDFRKIQVNDKFISVEFSDLISQSSEYSFTNILTPLRYTIMGQNTYDKTPKWMFNKIELGYFKRAYDIKKIINEQIQYRLQQRNQETDKTDFLRYIIDAMVKKEIDQETVLHLFAILFFAGMDTTAHLALITLYYLSIQPKEQEVLRNEINELIKTDADISTDNLTKMKQFNLFIQEVLRIRSPAPLIIPRQATQDHYIGEFFIPKNSYVNFNLMGVHYDSQQYANPEQFDMNRKNPNNSYNYIPFSAGPRNCIGQHMALAEVKVMMIKILKKYRIERNEKVPLKMIYTFLYEPKYDNLVNFVPINV